MDNKKPAVKRTGTAKIKKKSTAEKLKEVFVPDDVEQVKRHILIDLIVPRLKTISVDIFKAIVWGETNGSSNNSNNNVNRVSYRNYYDNKQQQANNARTGGPIFDDVILDSRGDAEATLNQVAEIIQQYGACSVLSLYDMVGLQTKYSQWTLQKYGWTSIDTATIETIDTPDGPGYLINLPKAIPLQ